MTAVLSNARRARAPRARAVLAALAVAAAGFAAVAHLLLFRHGSLNNDEVAYLLQAHSIAHGHLFPAVPQPAEAYQPWFFVLRDAGLVSKYLPLVSALLAVGLRLFDSIVPVLALLAALVPLLVAALARAAGLARRDAVLAAALVSLSPVVLMLSALPLSYVPSLVLVTAGWLLLVRLGTGAAGWRGAVLLGVAGSAAACARPYDAVLLLGPGLVWVALRRRAEALRLAGSVLLGGLPLAVGVALYDVKATGSALRLPFGLLEPQDAIGYGTRRLVPEDEPRTFGVLQGLRGLWVHFTVAPLTWFALAALLLPAAVVAARRPATSEAVKVLLGTLGVHVLGYAVFWGPWNFSVLWGAGIRVLGPVYTVPLVVPLALAGAPVLREWWERERVRLVRPLVGGAVAVAVVQLVYALHNAEVDRARTQELLAIKSEAVAAQGPLLLDVNPPYLGHPVSDLLDDTVLAAGAPVPPADAPTPDLLQLPGTVYGSPSLTFALSRTVRLAGPEVPLAVTWVGRRSDVLVVERGGRPTACAAPARARVVVTSTGISGCTGRLVPDIWTRRTEGRCEDLSCVVLVLFREDFGGTMRRVGWRELPVDTSSGSVALLADDEQVRASGAGWVRVESGAGLAPAPY